MIKIGNLTKKMIITRHSLLTKLNVNVCFNGSGQSNVPKILYSKINKQTVCERGNHRGSLEGRESGDG